MLKLIKLSDKNTLLVLYYIILRSGWTLSPTPHPPLLPPPKNTQKTEAKGTVHQEVQIQWWKLTILKSHTISANNARKWQRLTKDKSNVVRQNTPSVKRGKFSTDQSILATRNSGSHLSPLSMAAEVSIPPFSLHCKCYYPARFGLIELLLTTGILQTWYEKPSWINKHRELILTSRTHKQGHNGVLKHWP